MTTFSAKPSTFHKPTLLLSLAVGAVILIGASGCGESTGPSGLVMGKVTARGRPVDLGHVLLVKPDGVPIGSAQLTPTGEFQFPEPVTVGEYQVAVLPTGEEAAAGVPDPKLERSLKTIPPKYRSETTSGFKAVVKEGDNSFTFQIR